MKAHKINKRITFLLFCVLLILLVGCKATNSTEGTDKNTTPEVTGNIKNQEIAERCLQVLTDNLAAATTENIDNYLKTISEDSRSATKKEMTAFFSKYDLRHRLLSFEIVKQEKKSLLVEARQETINEGKEKYRDHVTQAFHTFVLEDGQWRIKETTMMDTQFLD
ncbi:MULTISPECIES: hypothetical protein [Enterococcus]|uniref:hypothetical protein n=1 Tax=Enterococcus TaxID=1350 RepID=UPI00069EF07A|nr:MULTISPECIES: hypothetical protein [Enterococcus]KAF1303199.1 hypothetical protein BAU16_05365 [Enterococcus sp. JM9B]